jgi:hypothetical protein
MLVQVIANGMSGEMVGKLPSTLTFFASFGDDILFRWRDLFAFLVATAAME